MIRALALAASAMLVLSSCGDNRGSPGTEPASLTEPAATEGTDTQDGETSAEEILERHGLDASGDGATVVDRMDRLGGDERPQDLLASVQADELVLTSGDDEATMALPEDQFYISMAPYVEQTHDCFYHALTTCQGELVQEELDLRIVDETNDEVLLDETVTTFENGFYGIWVPRDIEGTITVEHDGRTGEFPFSTDDEAPTCLTDMPLT